MPCTITCFIAFVIFVAMVFMTIFVSIDPFIATFKDQLSPELQGMYEYIVRERGSIHLNGYLLGFIFSVIVIVLNVYVFRTKMPISGMVCLVVVISFVTNYFYYTLSPKSTYMLDHIKKPTDKEAWLQMYRAMQYYYHLSFILGLISVGVFAYAFRGSCQ